MPPKSKVDLYAAIRRDARAGMSNRALQRKYGVGFRTVRAAMESVWPEPRKQLPPRKTRLDAFKPTIDQMLRADLDAPRKQRHTVKRIFDRLLDEHGAVEVTYLMVRAYVAVRRPQIRIEAGRGPLNAFIPQTHMPGAEAEVDFGDVTIRLAGEQVKVYLFSMRLSYSGKAVHRIFASCGQEAFFEGHVHALSVLGGVPCGKVRYDNLRAAVARVLGLSRARVENERWTAFRSHYGIESMYCRPGLEGAHEKGGVEGQIGWFRRNHLVPVPEVDSLAELNAMVERWDVEDDDRRIRSRPRTIGEYFAVERPLLQPLPDDPFVEVLLLGRHLHHEYLVTGLAAALRAGALTADAVALEARKAAEADDAPAAAADPKPDRASVTFLTERRLAHLPPDNRPLPSVAAYDQLLRPRQPDRSTVEGERP